MRVIAGRVLASLCFALFLASAHADDERGSLGFSVTVDADGFFLNPTLKSVTISSVVKASPAAGAGMAIGDLITEAEGHVIAGSKGRDLEPPMKVSVGQTLHLKLKRPNGEEYSAALVAVRKAPTP